MSGAVSRDELDWMFIALLGIMASSADTVLALREVGVHRHDRGPLKGIAISGLIKSFLLFAMTAIGVLAGVLAILTPEPIRPEVTSLHHALVNALVTYQALLVLVIVVKDWERWYVTNWEWHPTPARAPESPPRHVPLEVAPPCGQTGDHPCDTN